MKTCSGCLSNSMRPALGGLRCECGGTINDRQFESRVARRLNELDEKIGELTSALRTVGASKCSCCGKWRVGNLMLADYAWCADCLKADPWITIDEEDNEDSADETAIRVVRYLTGKGVTSLKLDGPFLDAYRKIAR